MDFGLEQQVAHYLERLDGPEHDDAFHALVESPPVDIWRQALDGLVTIGGGRALEGLRRVMETQVCAGKLAWIREAAEQIRSAMTA
jgi:hypothetical protein